MSNSPPAPPVLAIALLALGALSCASGSGGGGTLYGADFPTEQEVERIENTPPPEAVFDADLRQVHEWVLEATAPERIEAHLVSASPLGTAIGVSHRKDPDEAWGHYVVLIVSVAND